MRKVLISILTLIVLISMATVAYAATASISLSASSDTVLKGKTFTVTLAGEADNDISGLESVLTYDNTKLSLDKDNSKAATGFSDLSGTNSINIGLITNTSSKSATLYTLTFKVLENATEGETTVKVSNAKMALVNNGVQEEAAAEDQVVTVNIKADSTTAGEDKKSTEEAKETTEKKEKLPQTGIENTSLIAIVVLAIASIVSYVLYRKYRNV